MSEAKLWESNVLRNLQLSSEARGLRFILNPTREVLPPFLTNYEPEAIAVSPHGDGGIVIQVKRNRSRKTDRELAMLAKLISAHKGWELRVVYLNPSTETLPNIAKPTSEQITDRLEQIEELAKSGHNGAAFVIGWAVLESLARLASANNEDGSSRAYSPLKAIQTLAEEGYLENEAATQLREMVMVRNAVIHGDFAVDVPAEQVQLLLEQLKAVHSELMRVASEQAK